MFNFLIFLSKRIFTANLLIVLLVFFIYIFIYSFYDLIIQQLFFSITRSNSTLHLNSFMFPFTFFNNLYQIPLDKIKNSKKDRSIDTENLSNVPKPGYTKGEQQKYFNIFAIFYRYWDSKIISQYFNEIIQVSGLGFQNHITNALEGFLLQAHINKLKHPSKFERIESLGFPFIMFFAFLLFALISFVQELRRQGVKFISKKIVVVLYSNDSDNIRFFIPMSFPRFVFYLPAIFMYIIYIQVSNLMASQYHGKSIENLHMFLYNDSMFKRLKDLYPDVLSDIEIDSESSRAGIIKLLSDGSFFKSLVANEKIDGLRKKLYTKKK